MIDTERQEWIRDHTRGDVTEAEVLKEYNLLWPARRYMGRIIDEADALVECGWAKYKTDSSGRFILSEYFSSAEFRDMVARLAMHSGWDPAS